MSILFSILAFFACVATAACGAWGMRWHMEKTREVPEKEDPRDTQIRDLLAQVRMAKNDMVRSRTIAEDAEEHLKLAHERIDELFARSAKLSARAESAESDLQAAHSARDLLRDKLSAATQQLDTLKQRNQELELELSVAQDADMLEPEPGGNTPGADEDEIDRLGAMTTPNIDASTGSLLHALTAELERWKRHCHVLGDELKLHREKLAQLGATTETDENPFDSIDELTDIRGIGNAIARKLHQLGIYRYREIVSLSDGDRERAQMLIPDFDRRMRRDRWQEQARTLHLDKYDEPI